VILRLAGDAAVLAQFAEHEPGGHRFQRVPPTEKRNRVHSSSSTVAVLPVPEAKNLVLDERDLEWKMCRGSGAGGQHRNVTDSAVQLTHRPSGFSVRCESERSQHQNKALALDVLRSRLAQADSDRRHAQRSQDRKAQVGSGMRADWVRQVALQRNTVKDRKTGRTAPADKYLRGHLELLWDIE
jgi:peptide chain release factor 1